MTESSCAMFGRASAWGRRVAVGVAAAAIAIALTSGPSLAAVPPVYDNVPTTLPGNLGSVGFEATSTSEFGDLIGLGSGSRLSQDLPVTIVMSIWACQFGGDATCVTTPGASWPQALTLTLYSVDRSGTVPATASSLLSVTTVFDLPFRPSFDPAGPCAGKGTGWWSATDKACYNGMLHPVVFNLPANVTLPDELIWGISFTTSHYGPGHTGVDGWWNSLNVALQNSDDPPTYGTDVEPDSAFIASTADWVYMDGDAGDGAFRDDQGGWKGLAPLACFGVDCAVGDPLATPRPSTSATATVAGSPSASPSGTATPFQSIAGATGTPYQILAGATGIAPLATPPATTAAGGSEGSSSPLAALLLCAAFGAAALSIARSRRRSPGR